MKRNALYRFHGHKQQARLRNIPFFLTFEEWMDIWTQSGKWEQRGWRKGQYVMARHGDQGAYEKGNVIICLAEENRAERNRNYSLKGENNPAYGKDYWATASLKERKRRAQAVSKQMLGKPKTTEHKAAIAKAAIGRRRVVRNGCIAWAHPNDSDFPATL